MRKGYGKVSVKGRWREEINERKKRDGYLGLIGVLHPPTMKQGPSIQWPPAQELCPGCHMSLRTVKCLFPSTHDRFGPGFANIPSYDHTYC